MKNFNLSQKKFLETLQKHNADLIEQFNQQLLLMEKKDSLLALYSQALRGKILEMQKIVDISMLWEGNHSLMSEKIKKWILSWHTMQKNVPFGVSIQDIANMCSGDIIDYLKETYPNLNQDELDICAYICLNFSSDQIRYILDYKHDHSLYNKRHRIKCKIEDESQRELDVILKDMIKERFIIK